MKGKTECFVSVDVETAGPVPGEYSLLQIGACVVDEENETFACYLKPANRKVVPAALEITGIDLDELERTGLEPAIAMRSFAEWIEKAAEGDRKPVFVGLNAGFDWSFINYYFHRYYGKNPFGHSALDLKSLYMGLAKCNWSDTGAQDMAKYFGITGSGDHNALHDAQFQAVLFRHIWTKSRML